MTDDTMKNIRYEIPELLELDRPAFVRGGKSGGDTDLSGPSLDGQDGGEEDDFDL